MKIDIQKGSEHVVNALDKAAKVGRKAADSALAGVQSIVEKVQLENQKALIKKYNPVFPDQYRKVDFGLPNLVMIVDDAVRKDIEVCKGAIGWRSNHKGVEVFYLYDEAVAFSGLNFIPAAVCDSIYYVDPYDKSRFIRLDCYFDKMQESRLAELQQIAYLLGAKKYSVAIDEVASEKQTKSQKASARGNDFNISEEISMTSERESKRRSVAHAEFVDERQPTQPKLKWFAYDENIRNLIAMRCSGQETGRVKAYTMEFKGSDFATIGVNTAAKIDMVIEGISYGSSFKMQSKATEEHRHKLIFQIEF